MDACVSEDYVIAEYVCSSTSGESSGAGEWTRSRAATVAAPVREWRLRASRPLRIRLLAVR